MNRVIEIVVFEVSSFDEALPLAKAMIDEIQHKTGYIINAETYKSWDKETLLAQRIEWTSLTAAKEVMERIHEFPSAQKLFPMIIKTSFLEHFDLC